MLTLRSLGFSNLWLALTLVLTACGGGGGGGGDSKEGPGPVDPKPLPALVLIEVTPAVLSLPKGVSQPFTATGVYADRTTADLTDEVTWSSADGAIASVDASGLVKGETAGGPVAIRATLDGIDGSADVTVSNARLDAIDVTPASASVPAGMPQSFTATGTYSDGTTLDISDQVTWETSDPDVATIDAAGLASTHAKSAGITVTATLDAMSDTAALAVTDATLQSIEITPSAFSLAAGYHKDYKATGLYSDGTTLDLTDVSTWSSSDESVATVQNHPDAGEVHAIKKGAATIQAAYDGKSGTNVLKVTDAELVSIAVTADNASLAAGYAQTYRAQGSYSDGSTQDLGGQVVWSVSDETRARISNEAGSRGEATAIAAGGPLDVIATSGEVTGKAALTVTAAVLVAIEVTADAAELPAGLSQAYVATGVYSDGSDADLSAQVTWSSTDELVADVSNADGSRGLVYALTVGDTTIGAALDGVSGSRALSVTAAVLERIEVESQNDSLAAGAQQQYTATGLYSDGTTLDLTDVATWSSSDTGIAQISNADGSQGLATALVAGGPITIGASYDPGSGAVIDSRPLTVTAATLVEIVVTSGSDTLFAGLTQPYTATGVYSDDSEADITAFVTWSVPADALGTTVASITAEGLLTALAQGGPVDVTATLGAVSGSTELSVGSAALDALVLVPMEHALPLGLTVQFSVMGIYTDGTELDLTHDVLWSSSLPDVASISNADGSKGQATALSIGGPATITATMGTVSVSAQLTVTNATLTTLVVTPASLDLPRGVSQQYVATATFSDGSVQDVTQAAVWSSDNEAAATISNAAGSQGLAQTHAPGATTISATLEAFSPVPATAALTVNALIVESLEVRPEQTTCGRGKSKQFKAFVVYNDATEQDLTAQMRWTSGATRLVSIGLSTGLAKTTGNPHRLGDATITARMSGLSDTAVVHKIGDKSACTP